VEQGLRVVQPGTFKDPAVVSALADLRPDIIIVAAYGQILPDAVLRIPKYNCVNIHPSLLPKYRGPSPVTAAILNGDVNTGVTIMVVEKKVDSGPMLAQKESPVMPDDTTESLTARLATLGAALLIETLPAWVAGKIQPRVQNEAQASYTRMAAKDDGRLDWKLTAMQLERRVRAYYPWPGCFTDWKGMRLKVVKAMPVDAEGSGSIGEVVTLPRTGPARVAVRTPTGLLGLVTVQLEGKKEMPAADFVVGHRDFIGSTLT
jgi:methionyl-tRNA formyltransferase